MKSMLRRAAALLLSAMLLVPTALASDALGSRIYSYTLNICQNTTLTREVMWSASRKDLRTENYVTYQPSASVSPQVSFGSSVLAMQTVTSMAKDLEKDGDRVLSGINGDYFVMATGNPLGLLVTDGVLRSSASYLNALGFKADGTAVIGKPDLTLRADFKGYSLKISEINKIRESNGYYLYSEDFGTTTKNTKPGVDIILTPVTTNPGQTVKGADGTSLIASRQLGIGKMVYCKVDKVVEATGATPIPQGKLVFSIAATGNDWLLETARSLQPGDTMNIEIFSQDTRWNQVDCAVGAMYWILSGGKVTSTLDATTAAPRTAVGIKPDGKVIFYTIDGRQSGHSVGATEKMVAQRLAELGCTEAVLLDGGGSTTMVSTYPDYGSSALVNKPSEGSLRSVTNAIFLVSNLSPTGTPGSLYVSPTSLMLLPGATTQCVATAMDSGWYPMKTLPGTVTWSSPEQAVSESGLFTAPAKTGVYTVTAASGGVSGSAKIQVYDTPDSIYVNNKATGKNVSTVSMTPGQTMDLDAAASYRTIGLTGGDRCFTWSCDPAIGTITPDGVFTAGSATATGKIKVAAGNFAVTITVNVTAPGYFRLLDDFEGSSSLFTSNNARLTPDTTAANVQYGRQSLQVSYTFNKEALMQSKPTTITEKDRILSMWVYGDNSGNTLSAAFSKSDGSTVTQSMTQLNFSGWKYLSAAVPADAAAFTGLLITGSQTKGTIWLDQLTLSNQKERDSAAPTVNLSVNESSVTAKLSDNAENSLSKDRISLTVDGKAVPFQYSKDTLTATLAGLGSSLHRVTVTAADCCGNLGRASVTLAGTSSAQPFADMNGHWAADCTARLNELGIISGVQEGSRLNFLPNRSITRGDFALMAARWLGLDAEKYRSVSLPYADAASIPGWDLNAVKALYAEGIMQGSRDANGTLRANASASITRAEAMTILGRMQAKGYPDASLSAFSDAGSVPAWAKPYVSSLVGQQVVSGSDGNLRPGSSVTRAEVAKMLFTLW